MTAFGQYLAVTGFALVLFCSTAFSQYTENQIQELRLRSEVLDIQWQRDRSEAEIRAVLTGIPLRIVREDGRIMELQRFVNDRPEYYITDNAVSASTISSSRLHPGGVLGLSLTGAGISVAEWDGGRVRTTHQEFGNRVTQMDNTSSQSDHATHVAATMIASGVKAEAKGMAPEGLLLAHDWNNDLSEMTARAADGVQVSNHSYGSVTGWINNYRNDGRWAWFGVPGDTPVEDRNFGRYEERARQWDQLVMSAQYYLPVKSAGNDRGEGPSSQPVSHWVNVNGNWTLSNTVREKDGGADGFDCVTSYGNAKNILTVGAVEDIPGGYRAPGDVRMSSFSGWGPTDDGRIKPDIVANGVGLYSAIRTSNTAYATYSGTSMSAPSVTGSIALLLQHQKNLHGTQRLRASTIKALLLHTADEAGPAPGPDFMHGWGLMNTASAAKLMSAKAQNNPSVLILEEDLRNGQTISKQIYSPGRGPLKVTICWTDPAGPVQPGKVNPTNRVLVNDLDLRIIDPSTGQHLPWVMNPANPAAPAGRGDNIADNVEQVYIQTPDEGNYIIRITHKGTLQGESQWVSIVANVTNQVSLLSPPNGLGNSSITPALQWNLARGAQSYELQVAEASDFASPVVNATGLTLTWYDTPGLKKNALYFWRVRARDQKGVSEWSDVWSFTTGGNTTQAGHALEFDGTDDHVVRHDVTGFEVLEQNDALSIEAWVYPRGWVNGSFAIASKHNSSSGQSWSLRLKSNAIEFHPAGVVTCGTTIPLNSWTHVAVTYSKASGKVRFYVNGVRRCESNFAGDLQSTAGGPLYLGYVPSASPATAYGIMDEVRVWSTVRTEEEINMGMFGGYNGTEAGLLAQYTFNDASGLTTTAMPGGKNADLVQGPAWVVSGVPMARPPAPVLTYPANNSGNIPISATAIWQPATSALRYRVQLSREANFSNLLMDAKDVTATTQAFPQLLPETGYYWRANSSNATGISDWSTPHFFTTAVAPPDAPRLITPKNGAKDQPLLLTLLWDPPARSLRYHVQVSTDSLFAGAFLIDNNDVQSPSINVPDLGNNQPCYWRVRALNAGGSSPWSEHWVFTTIPAEPEAPILLTPQAEARGVSVNPSFTWETSDGATAYHMQLSTDASFQVKLLDAAAIPFARYAAANLARGTWHFWRVRATNAAGASEWSEVRRFLTERDLPEVVQLVAPQHEATMVDVRTDFLWLPLVSADTYTLQLSADEQFATTLLAESGLTGDSWKPAQALPAESELFWRVRASNERGDGPWSAVWSFTTGALPLGVPELRLPPHRSVQAPEKVDFAWTAVTEADAYTLELGTDTLAAFTRDATDEFLSLTNLAEESEHFWRVRSKRGTEEGPWSAWWSFTTTLRLPDVVTLLAPLNGSVMQSDTVQFVWTRSQPQVHRYWFEYAFEGFLGQTTVDSTRTDTSMTIPLAALASPCYWRVRAGNSAGWGPFSASGSFIPLMLSAGGTHTKPTVITLGSAWPNPAASRSAVLLSLSKRSHATLELRDVLGREVAIVHDAALDAGTHAIPLDVSSLQPGHYLLLLRGDGAVATQTLVVLR
jgi:hypothetical protein